MCLLTPKIESPAYILIIREGQLPNHIKQELFLHSIGNHCNFVNGIVEDIHQKSSGNWRSRVGEYRVHHCAQQAAR